MKHLITITFTVILFAYSNIALAAAPLVDAAWVKNNIGKTGIVFLDVTSNPAAYAKGHVPGAVYTHYKKDQWRIDKKVNGKTVKGLLPDVAHLEKLISGFGISNNDHVIVIANGFSAAEMGTATRLYWTFKAIGHEEVSILNGGMANYLGDKTNPLQTKSNKPKATSFKGSLNSDIIATEKDVQMALKNNVKLLDLRSYEQHLGINKSGSVERAGTLPGAILIPGLWMTENSGNVFRDTKQLSNLYNYAGAPVEGDTITFCNTGHWASVGWFVSSELLGNKKTKLYDGSMSEWTINSKNPMQRKVEY